MNLIITMRLKILKHTINIKYKSKNNVSGIVIILLIVVFAVVGVFIPIRPPIKVQAVNISKNYWVGRTPIHRCINRFIFKV